MLGQGSSTYNQSSSTGGHVGRAYQNDYGRGYAGSQFGTAGQSFAGQSAYGATAAGTPYGYGSSGLFLSQQQGGPAAAQGVAGMAQQGPSGQFHPVSSASQYGSMGHTGSMGGTGAYGGSREPTSMTPLRRGYIPMTQTSGYGGYGAAPDSTMTSSGAAPTSMSPAMSPATKSVSAMSGLSSAQRTSECCHFTESR